MDATNACYVVSYILANVLSPWQSGLVVVVVVVVVVPNQGAPSCWHQILGHEKKKSVPLPSRQKGGAPLPYSTTYVFSFIPHFSLATGQEPQSLRHGDWGASQSNHWGFGFGGRMSVILVPGKE